MKDRCRRCGTDETAVRTEPDLNDGATLLCAECAARLDRKRSKNEEWRAEKQRQRELRGRS